MIRPPKTRRLLAAVAVAPLLSTALVACGGDGDGEDTAADPAAQSSATTDPGATTETDVADADSIDVDDLEDGQTVTAQQFADILAEGIQESTTARMSTSTSFGGVEMTSDGVVDYTTSPPSLQMQTALPGGNGTFEVISVDGLMYLDLGQMSQGKFWRIDPSDPDGALAGLGLDKVLEQNDPVAALRAMADSLDEVVYVGEEQVSGRDLDRFEMTVDLAAATKGLGADLPPSATKSMPKTLTYDVWLDDEGRFAQMVMELPTPGGASETRMVMDDWGTDVGIEAPPADQVTEMPDPGQMMGQMTPSPTA